MFLKLKKRKKKEKENQCKLSLTITHASSILNVLRVTFRFQSHYRNQFFIQLYTLCTIYRTNNIMNQFLYSYKKKKIV